MANVAERPMPRARNDEPVQAHLGKGSRIEGKLQFEGSVKIDGDVDGEIQAQQAVIVGESAVLNAQINAQTVIVKGKVTGDVTARKQVELREPAKLTGNINTPSLVIHEGVVFEGHCSMGGRAESRADKADKKVTFFPKEERSNTTSVMMPSEAAK
ncbi:MAG: polymer-forming cytoskeletal protein [Candidatus Binatia bacterium]